MRGGVSYIAQGHSKVNNKYMKSYGKEKPCKCIICEDANNLYGWAMSRYLPFGGFKCVTKLLYIYDGCCTEFNLYCFMLYLFWVINDSIFSLIMLVENGILFKNHVSCNLC